MGTLGREKVNARRQSSRKRGKRGPLAVDTHLLQKLDLILQELVNMLRLLLSLLKLAPELSFIMAVEILHISAKTRALASQSQSYNLASGPIKAVSVIQSPIDENKNEVFFFSAIICGTALSNFSGNLLGTLICVACQSEYT